MSGFCLLILITHMKIKYGWFFLVHIKCVNFSTVVLQFCKEYDKVLALLTACAALSGMRWEILSRLHTSCE